MYLNTGLSSVFVLLVSKFDYYFFGGLPRGRLEGILVSLFGVEMFLITLSLNLKFKTYLSR